MTAPPEKATSRALPKLSFAALAVRTFAFLPLRRDSPPKLNKRPNGKRNGNEGMTIFTVRTAQYNRAATPAKDMRIYILPQEKP